MLRNLVLTICIFNCYNCCGQSLAIKGKVTDSRTGEGIPYATITLKGTGRGTTSNIDGLYQLQIIKKTDSVVITCMGYFRKAILLTSMPELSGNIQLEPASNSLQEIVITPKGYVNPAWSILREVIKHKHVNDPRSLLAYEYESYNRIELDVTHLSNRLKNKKSIKSVLAVTASMQDSSSAIGSFLPIFVSETASDFYYHNNPEIKKEIIKRTKTNGVGFEDGTLVAQLTGSIFQQHNFYKNYLSAAGKDFISPIADGWKSNYDYELQNRNAKIDTVVCYQISFRPKQPQALAFTGTIWISKQNYALYKIKATVEPSANLNFIKRITIQQQMIQALNGAALVPGKTDIQVEVEQLSKNTTGLLAKFYTVNKNFQINKNYNAGFFKEAIVLAEDVQKKDDQFWDRRRPDSLTKSGKSIYPMIDTVKSLPVVKNYVEIADLLINGYFKIGNISLGPFLQGYGNNNVEGNRIRLGFKTNSSFDKKWVLGGYLAYGTKDADFKYGTSIDYIIRRKRWTEAGISLTHDLNQVALLSDSYIYQRNNLFAMFTRYGRIDKRRVFDQNTLNLYIKSNLLKGFTETVTYSNWTFSPLYIFPHIAEDKVQIQEFTVSEFQIESKWAPGNQPLVSESLNSQTTVKSNVSLPLFTFRYVLGVRNLFGGDVAFHKLSLNIVQTLKLGALGRGKYSFTMGYIPSSVPYPLLENHLGNSTFIYNPCAFNLMQFFEFASDKYVSLNYTQHFEGAVFNYLPVIKKFKWRLVGTANILYGSLSQKNANNILKENRIGIKGLKNTPYIEAGYGIENIFKFFRVDFIHRLTYKNNSNSFDNNLSNFGIKLSAQIRL